MRVKFEIPGEPVGKGRPRFSNGKVYTPTKTRNYEALMRYIYINKVNYLFDRYVKVKMTCYYGIAKSDSKKKKAQKLAGELRPSKKPDLDNCLKMIDSLNGIAFKDDAFVVEMSAVKYFSDNPRVIIEIEDVEGAEKGA